MRSLPVHYLVLFFHPKDFRHFSMEMNQWLFADELQIILFKDYNQNWALNKIRLGKNLPVENNSSLITSPPRLAWFFPTSFSSPQRREKNIKKKNRTVKYVHRTTKYNDSKMNTRQIKKTKTKTCILN